MNMSHLFDAKFIQTVLGFVVTTFIGGLIGAWIQRKSWERQTKSALLQKQYDEGVRLLDDITDSIGARYFMLQRVIWTLRDASPEIKAARFEQYMEIVKAWNLRLKTFRNKVRILIGEEFAKKLLNYDDENCLDRPSSVHYKFVKAHNAMLAARKDDSLIEAAQQEIEDLNGQCSIIIEEFTDEFIRRTQRMEILKHI